MNAVSWASDDVLVCAVDHTGALFIGEVTPDGKYMSTQRVEIAAPSPLWLVPGSGDSFIALCGASAPVMLRLNVDVQRRCIDSTTTYALDAPATCLAMVAGRARTDAFVVDTLGISHYVIDDAAETAADFTTESEPSDDRVCFHVRHFGTRCSEPCRRMPRR